MKTGTHSVAELLSGAYRSVHEAHVNESARILTDWKRGRATREETARRLRKRDRRWRAECESAHFLAPMAGILADIFPEARFILTVREPRRWLTSMVDQHLNYSRENFETPNQGGPQGWVDVRDVHFGAPPWNYPEPEGALVARDVPPLGRLLSYWSESAIFVLENVPKRRLLIIRTRDLSRSRGRISAFLGVPAEHLRGQSAHAFQSKKHHGVTRQIEESYIEQRVSEHCQKALEMLKEADVQWEAASTALTN